jgi:WD40 repeat protein
VTKERNVLPANSEVERLALSECGLHLATLEACWAPVPRVTLKFWQYQLGSQRFALNTQVESPHEGAVSLLSFQPRVRREGEVWLLSCGEDSRAKVWRGTPAAWDCRLCIGNSSG